MFDGLSPYPVADLRLARKLARPVLLLVSTATFSQSVNAAELVRFGDGWTEDYNDNHPNAGPKWRSPRELIAAQTATV